jgi:hypothetical protein
VLSAGAALTKGNGFALLLVPGIVILLSGAWRQLRRADMWLAGVVAVGLCAPWYVLTSGRFSSSFAPNQGLGFARREFTTRASLQYWSDLTANLGVVGVLGAGAAAAWWAYRSRSADVGEVARGDARARLVWPATAACAVAFHVFVPILDIDVRYVLVAIPALAITLAFAAADVAGAVRRRGASAAGGPSALPVAAIYLAVVAVALPGWPRLRTPPEHGLRAAARRVVGDPTLGGQRILVSSGSATETALVAEFVALDGRRPTRVVTRAGQQLAQSGWSLENYQRRFDTPAEVAAWLRRAGIRTVVFDHSPMTSPVVTHHPQLDSALALGDWRLVGSFAGAADPSFRTAVYRYVGPDTPITERMFVNAKGTVLRVPMAGER